MTYKSLAEWVPTPIALIAYPFALVIGLVGASFCFLFKMGFVRYLVDRLYTYTVFPLFRYMDNVQYDVRNGRM